MNHKSDLRAGGITVYGTDWCGWKKKQKEYFDKKGTPYTYVNCEATQCPSFVEAFPTLDVDGKITTGFTEL